MTVSSQFHIPDKVQQFKLLLVTPFCLLVFEKKFLSTLVKLNIYLEAPLPYELEENPNVMESSRHYLDGDTLTLADCNLLPKLHIVKVSRD